MNECESKREYVCREVGANMQGSEQVYGEVGVSMLGS